MWLSTVSRPAVLLLALLAPAFGDDAGKGGGDPRSKANSDWYDVTAGASFLSDYIYRGISLSKRAPSGAGYVEVVRDGFYVNGQLYTVRLPTVPAAELTFAAGIRRTFAGTDFDLGAEYYYYPGETLPAGTNPTSYWQTGLSATRRVLNAFEVIGTVTGSPDVWNSGAWGFYGAGGLKLDLPKLKLANGDEVTWSLAGEVGRETYGRTSEGNLLPAYAHWKAALTFKYDKLSLDLSYQDTNLSKEDCYVLTGDSSSGAIGTGRFASDTGGLQSNLCGRAFVAILSIELSAPK
jgi:uncharacterized protein (TIGR02001 family)